MRDQSLIKEVAIYPGAENFVAEDGQPTMLDVYFIQKPECKRVCNACPRRVLIAGAIVVEDFRVVDGSTKADKGSEVAGLKRLDGVPACFHPDRVFETDQA